MAKKQAAAQQKAVLKKSGLPVLSVRPDILDFRDAMYRATLVEVPRQMPLAHYLKAKVPILDQGAEGACTGFALATVAHFLLRTRRNDASTAQVSPHMLYDLARRYDEWQGEDYEGSSARGAMKGWHKHGVCRSSLWKKSGEPLDQARAADALQRPLGAYYRVNHKDLVAMHAALAEVGVLFATASVHRGWDQVGSDGLVPFDDALVGGHAFAIVGYDEQGFWFQNSWGSGWGHKGFGHLSYADWLANGMDVWAARLGVPVTVGESAISGSEAGRTRAKLSFVDLRPHVVSLGNDGKLRAGGMFGTTPTDLDRVFTQQMPAQMQGWKTPRILLYAHGGLVDEHSALKRVEEYLKPLLGAEVYPLAFIWKSDFWSTVSNVLKDAFRDRRAEGFLDKAKDFMLDRTDDLLEPIARAPGKLLWDEMKENALRASQARPGEAPGGAVEVLSRLQAFVASNPQTEIHIAGHSAGSIFMAPMVAALRAAGIRVRTLTLWAPACTMELFQAHYLPALRDGTVGNFGVFNLSDAAERDDNCAKIYNKSLLYLVSDAFENRTRIPLIRPDGEPLLGMDKFASHGADALPALLKNAKTVFEYVLSPNHLPAGDRRASGSTSHGGFDDDPATVRALLARITGQPAGAAPVSFARSKSAWLDRKQAIVSAL